MKLLKSKFVNAFNGLSSSFHDKAVLIQVIFTLCAVTAGFLFRLSHIEWCLIIFCCGLVVICEIINTCIEKIMDFIHPDYHAQVKIIKDMSAGFVLVAAILAVVIGLIIFGGKL